jgi:hypothetical protein
MLRTLEARGGTSRLISFRFDTMNAPWYFQNEGQGIFVPTAVLQLREIIGGLAEHWADIAARRSHRPLLSLVGVPLAIVAAVSMFQFWLVVPLLALSWWWAPADWPWGWLLAVMEAGFGVQWVYFGAILLDGFPHLRIVIGVVWALFAGLIAVAGMVNRRLTGRRYGW